MVNSYSIKQNLDPESNYSDLEIKQALIKGGLENFNPNS